MHGSRRLNLQREGLSAFPCLCAREFSSCCPAARSWASALPHRAHGINSPELQEVIKFFVVAAMHRICPEDSSLLFSCPLKALRPLDVSPTSHRPGASCGRPGFFGLLLLGCPAAASTSLPLATAGLGHRGTNRMDAEDDLLHHEGDTGASPGRGPLASSCCSPNKPSGPYAPD